MNKDMSKHTHPPSPLLQFKKKKHENMKLQKFILYIGFISIYTKDQQYLVISKTAEEWDRKPYTAYSSLLMCSHKSRIEILNTQMQQCIMHVWHLMEFVMIPRESLYN
jgi:hypothetical protein